MRIRVEDVEGSFLCQKRALASARRSRRTVGCRLLSPFDSAVIRRDLVRSIFNYDYTLECYRPQKARAFGYFCLPILCDNRFVGRLDPKADRKRGVLVVNSIWFESMNGFDEIAEKIADELKAFASFNGCADVEVVTSNPKKALAPLRRALKSI